MKIKSLIVLALLVSAGPAFGKAATYKNAVGSGNVEFLAVGKPSMLKIHGKAAGPAAELQIEKLQLKGSVAMAMAKFETGINLRDEHMKNKYLQVKEFPEAKLTLLDAPVDSTFEKSLSTSGEKKFKGKLLLHGKEKEVNGTFSVKEGLINATFPITLSDFAVDVPKYLGVTVADTVDVTVELPLKKQ